MGKPTPLITLLTDFGLVDEYVGVMKGVIAGISPATRVVDISHFIDPQDIVHGAFILAAAFPYFPPGSIHVAVVDPGVGTGRRILAAVCDDHFFIAPDNGLLEIVMESRSVTELVDVTETKYFLSQVGSTFHGRDIFSPVAAHLAQGLTVASLGPVVDQSTIVSGIVPHCRFLSKSCIEGCVVAVDRFGNLMTNINKSAIDRLTQRWMDGALVVELNGKPIGGLMSSYDQVANPAPLAIIGSRGLLEISVNCDSAQQVLKAGKRSMVRVALSRAGEPCSSGPGQR